jgi:hypothetical protein
MTQTLKGDDKWPKKPAACSPRTQQKKTTSLFLELHRMPRDKETKRTNINLSLGKREEKLEVDSCETHKHEISVLLCVCASE